MPNKPFGATFMEKLLGYNDGNGMSRSDLVNELLIIVKEWSDENDRAPVPAVATGDGEAERIRIIAYLLYDTVYSDDFCVRCSHCPSNCECAQPVYMAGWQPNDKLKALKVALFQEDFDDALRPIAEAARNFMWEPENWEAYQDSKNSNSAAWPPEFLLMAQAVEKKYGPMLIDDATALSPSGAGGDETCRGRLRKLLNRYTLPCLGECDHSQCPLLKELWLLSEDERIKEAFSNARETVRPIVDAEKNGEDTGWVMGFRLDATTPVPQPVAGKCPLCGHRATVNGVCQVEVDGPLDLMGNHQLCRCHCDFSVPAHRCDGINGRERHGTQNKCSVCGEYREGWYDENGMEIIPRVLAIAQAVCWHCGVVLAYVPTLRCEDCPTECDVEGCDEMGCARVPAAAPVVHTVECDVWVYPHRPCNCGSLSAPAAAEDERAVLFNDVIMELHRVRDVGCGWPNREFVISHIEAIRDGLKGNDRGDGSYTAATARATGGVAPSSPDRCTRCDGDFAPTGGKPVDGSTICQRCRSEDWVKEQEALTWAADHWHDSSKPCSVCGDGG